MKDTDKPIEVWLSQAANMNVTCRVVYDDESGDELEIYSLSLRGAQREITAWLIGRGWEPAGRWQNEDEDADEVSRKFRRVRDRAGTTAAG
jgi:hypothetical protein